MHCNSTYYVSSIEVRVCSPSLSTSAPPLTVDTVLTAVQGVNYRALAERLLHAEFTVVEGKVNWFFPKLDEDDLLYLSDDDCLRAVIECWMQGNGIDEKPSWRRIIYALDVANDTRIADNIRHHAEPVSGKS